MGRSIWLSSANTLYRVMPQSCPDIFAAEEIEQSIPQRFEKIVGLYPDGLAFEQNGSSVDYAKLNQYANRIARAILKKRGPGSEPIALVFEHGIDVIAAILGTLKAGKFYVALDASSPCDRINYILNDSRARLILSNSRNIGLAQKLTSDSRAWMNIDEIDSCDFSSNIEIPISPHALASILYTSGSTGKPKGVAHSHRSQLHTVMVNTNQVGIYRRDRLTLLHTIGFGSAQAHLFQSLLNGASLWGFDLKSEGIHRLAKWLNVNRITVYHSPPAVFRQLAETLPQDQRLSDLRLIRLSGAPVKRLDFDLYCKEFAPDVSLQIVMNSTEANAIASFLTDRTFLFPETGSPAGYPVPGKDIVLLDERGREVARGETGEIAVESCFLPPGYWDQTEIDGGKLSLEQRGSIRRICRTGDLGRVLSDGFLIHLGRKDTLVKVRGYRVSLVEIEKALSEHPAIREAAVIAWDDDFGEKYLVAYVSANTNRCTTNELHEFLRKKLPDYMIPPRFVFLKSLPLVNGKLDRESLPKPDHERPQLAESYAAPASEVEKRLVKIWEEILDVRPVGVNDNFFDLGGDSLSAARTIGSVHTVFAVDLPVESLFQSPTISQMAIQLSAELDQRSPDYKEKPKPLYLVELQAGRGKTPVFIFPGGGGGDPEFFVYMPLIRRIGAHYPFYGLRARGGDGVSAPHLSVEEMASAYLEEIRSIQPHGPYRFVGECAGGITAYEAASQLRAAGEEVGLLALIDVQRPTLGKYIFYRMFIPPEPVRRKWIYVSVRAKHHWGAVRNLRWSERLNYVSNQAPRILRSHVHIVRSTLPRHPKTMAILKIQTQATARRRVLRSRENYRQIVRLYRAQPYDGEVELFATQKLHRRDPTLGWSELVRKLHIHPLPGNHWTSLRDHSEIAAMQLRKCLDLTDAESQA